MKTRCLAVPFGAAFGFLLSWGRMTDPEAVRAMLLLREWNLFLIMGSATAVGFVGAHLLRATQARSLIGDEPITWTRTRPTRQHVIGSVLFGLGWCLACTCPGPLAVQLGTGRFGALFIIAGVLGGIALRARQLSPQTAAITNPTTATAGL